MNEKISIEDYKCFIGNKDGVDIKNENPESYIGIPFKEYKELLITKGKYEELKKIDPYRFHELQSKYSLEAYKFENPYIIKEKINENN